LLFDVETILSLNKSQKMMKKNLVSVFAVVVLVFLCVGNAEAQCAMCKAAAEANLKTGGSDPVGLNAGILYMLLMPYLMVAAIGIWWYRNRRKEATVVPYTPEELAKWN
jgi:hypothetical protein